MDTLHLVAVNAKEPLPLNLFIWVAFVLAMIVKLTVLNWKFNLKLFTGNFAIIATIYAITQWFITKTPEDWYFQIVYVFFAMVICASPVELYLYATKKGTKTAEDKIDDFTESFKKKETTTLTKTIETAGTPPSSNSNPDNK